MWSPLLVPALALALALLPLNAGAAVYRCVGLKDRPLFTDRPCAAGSRPMELHLPQSIAAGASMDLAKGHDERLGREKEGHAKADSAWLAAHAEQTEEEARLRKALVESRVVQGMSAGQVRQAWGEPSDIENSVAGGATRERWTWRDGKRRRTVSFEDGKVRGMSGNRKD